MEKKTRRRYVCVCVCVYTGTGVTEADPKDCYRLKNIRVIYVYMEETVTIKAVWKLPVTVRGARVFPRSRASVN